MTASRLIGEISWVRSSAKATDMRINRQARGVMPNVDWPCSHDLHNFQSSVTFQNRFRNVEITLRLW